MPYSKSRFLRETVFVVTTTAALLAIQGCVTRLSGAEPQVKHTSATSSVPRSVFLDDLTSQELQLAIESGYSTALVYSGSTEGNGPHLALGKHNFRAPYYAERIARELGSTLVGQVVPFGVNPENIAKYPGTIALRPETFIALHEDVVRSLVRAGFTRIVLLTEHGPNVAALQAAGARLDAEHAPQGVRVFVSTDNYTKSTAEIEAWGMKEGMSAGGHAGLWDSSELWLIDSSKLRTDLIAAGDPSSSAKSQQQQVTGDPRHSSPALGQLFADIRVRNGVAEIRQMLQGSR